MFDYHVHTSFSSDCHVSMSEMIKSAIKKGIKEIAITDHIDYEYPDMNFEFNLDFNEYHKALNVFKEEYKDKIKIVKGLEIGLQQHIIKTCEDTVHAYPYDFVICSLHTAEKKDLHNGDYFKEKPSEQAYKDYYTYMYHCLKYYKSYSVIGHLNLIDRYKKYINNTVKYETYWDIIQEILKLIIDDGKGIEINTSCFRYGMKELTPTLEMLKLYREMSGEIITVGSDAHTPDYIGYKFEHIYDLLEAIGFKYIATFDNMKAKFIKL